MPAIADTNQPPSIAVRSAEKAAPSRLAKLLPVVAAIIYTALLCVLVGHHESWGDEADSWLVARDDSFITAFKSASYMGTPVLWYTLLMPAAKLGLPYFSMNVMNAVFGWAAIMLLLFASPLPLLLRLLIPFSYLFSYEYPAVARSYSLSILLIFLLAVLHNKRNETSFSYATTLALLCNTNVHGLIVALIIGAAWTTDILVKQRFSLITAGRKLAPLAVGAALAVFQLIPHADGQLLPPPDHGMAVVSMREAFLPSLDNLNHSQFVSHLTRFQKNLATLFALVIMATIALAVRRSRWALFVFFCGVPSLCALFAFKYAGYVRHWGFAVVIGIYALWIAGATRSDTRAEAGVDRMARMAATAALTLAMLISINTAAKAWKLEVQKQFSGAKAMAQFIQQNNLGNVQLVANPSVCIEPVIAYFGPRQVYFPAENRFGSHCLWCSGAGLQTGKSMLQNLNEQFPAATSDILLITPNALTDASKSGFRFVHAIASDTLCDREHYFLYARGPHAEDYARIAAVSESQK